MENYDKIFDKYLNSKYCYDAKIYSVYDGDTCKCEIDLGMNVSIKQTIRLYGIDTPELRGDEREQGLIVRDFVRDKILNKQVIVNTILDKTGKYGRYLGIIFIDGVNLNKLLLELNYANVY